MNTAWFSFLALLLGMRGVKGHHGSGHEEECCLAYANLQQALCGQPPSSPSGGAAPGLMSLPIPQLPVGLSSPPHPCGNLPPVGPHIKPTGLRRHRLKVHLESTFNNIRPGVDKEVKLHCGKWKYDDYQYGALVSLSLCRWNEENQFLEHLGSINPLNVAEPSGRWDPRVEVTGEVTSVRDAQIKLHVPNPLPADATLYVCDAKFINKKGKLTDIRIGFEWSIAPLNVSALSYNAELLQARLKDGEVQNTTTALGGLEEKLQQQMEDVAVQGRSLEAAQAAVDQQQEAIDALASNDEAAALYETTTQLLAQYTNLEEEVSALQGALAPKPQLLLETGTGTCGRSSGWESKGNLKLETHQQPLQKAYSQAPQVLVSVAALDASPSSEEGLKVKVTATQVSPSGFSVECSTWGNGTDLHTLAFNWLAYGFGEAAR